VESCLATEAEKAYAAGLVDGQGGSIRDKPRRGRGHALLVTLALRAPTAVGWLQERWPGSLRPTTKHPKGRDAFVCWEGRRHTSAAGAFLSDIFPSLLLKKAQAHLAIAFQSHKSFTYGRRLTDEVLALEESFRTRLLALRDGLRRAAVLPPHVAPLAG
jgi:hypothetical protein